MDDLEQKLTSLLQDPAAMERVESLLHSLGTEEKSAAAPTEPAPATPDLSGLLGLLGTASAAAPESSSAAPSLDGLLAQLKPLLSASAGGSPDTALLQALRPYLHGQREKRLDDALHILQLKDLLPLLNRS